MHDMQDARRYVGAFLIAVTAIAAALAGVIGPDHVGWFIACIIVAGLTFLGALTTVVPDLRAMAHRGTSAQLAHTDDQSALPRATVADRT
jgi:hypothetical protein